MTDSRDGNAETATDRERAQRRLLDQPAPGLESAAAEHLSLSAGVWSQALTNEHLRGLADSGRRSEVVLALQQRHGNAYVQRLMSPAATTKSSRTADTEVAARAAGALDGQRDGHHQNSEASRSDPGGRVLLQHRPAGMPHIQREDEEEQGTPTPAPVEAMSQAIPMPPPAQPATPGTPPTNGGSQSDAGAPSMTPGSPSTSGASQSIPDVTGGRPALHRHALEGADRDDLKSELLKLNGLSIEDLLGAMAAKDAHTRGHYAELAGEVGDVSHEERLRICAKAIDAKGTSAAAFALANEADLTAVVGGMGGGHIGQMDAILKFVDGSFDAKSTKLVAGDRLATNLGAQGAIVRPENVRVRTSGALTWIAANPGAIGAAPAFKPVGAYAGKTVGAGLSVFPDDDTGFAALLQWIALKAAGGSTCGSFFHAHAPTAEELAGRLRKKEGREPTEAEMTKFEAATKGNDPERYLANVAKAMGSTADAMRGKPLKSVDAARFGAAIRTEEGWDEHKPIPIDEAIKDTNLPPASRFRLLYTKLAGGVT